MRAVQTRIQPSKLFRKKYHVPIVRLGDQRNSFDAHEVASFCQGDAHSVSRVGAVGNQVLTIQISDARVFDTELFVLGKGAALSWLQERLRIGGEMKSIQTA